MQAELAALDPDIDFTVDDLDLADEYVASAPAGSDEHSVGGPVHADEPAVEVLAEDEAMQANTTIRSKKSLSRKLHPSRPARRRSRFLPRRRKIRSRHSPP